MKTTEQLLEELICTLSIETLMKALKNDVIGEKIRKRIREKTKERIRKEIQERQTR